MLKWTITSLLALSTYTALAQSDECAFAGHGTAAYDATNRNELAPCSDGVIRASLTSCRDTRPQSSKKKSKSESGIR